MAGQANQADPTEEFAKQVEQMKGSIENLANLVAKKVGPAGKKESAISITDGNTIEDKIEESMKGRVDGDDKYIALQEATGVRVAGFLGKSNLTDITRLYLNPQLDEYIEVQTDYIDAVVDLGGSGSLFVLLVIDKKAEVNHVTAVTRNMPVNFVSGEITRRNLNQNRIFGSSYIAANGPIPANSNTCGSFAAACGSWSGGCGSFAAACGSWGGGCGSFAAAC